MSNPGSNLLLKALTVIASQTVIYYRFLSRATNSIGQDINVYAAPIVIKKCSFQPIPRQKTNELGLDINKDYFKLYAPIDIQDLRINNAPDKISYQGKDYICEQKDGDWFLSDGWTETTCVRVY